MNSDVFVYLTVSSLQVNSGL